ncbi:MAG: hypothetical protein U0M15_09990 [Bacillota bacterium]|nr:hypothetical protein [Bacillota bacterium]
MRLLKDCKATKYSDTHYDGKAGICCPIGFLNTVSKKPLQFTSTVDYDFRAFRLYCCIIGQP